MYREKAMLKKLFTSRLTFWASSVGLMAWALLTGSFASAQQPTWMPQGPGPNTHGQVENIDGGEVIGAVKAVAPHPADPNVVYLGSVNGGIWKTTDAMDAKPHWQQQTDASESLSVGALAFDPGDATHQTLVAGAGRFSSLSEYGGRRIGLLRTTNGGTSWTAVAGTDALKGLNVSGIAPSGQTVALTVNDSDDCDAGVTCDSLGVWRCTISSTCAEVSGTTGTGLPSGPSSSLARDPTHIDVLYTNAGPHGLYKSTNGGAAWNKVSNSEMDSLIAQADNIKIAVGISNNVYVAIDVPVDADGHSQLAGVFRSGNGGASWSRMDLPATPDGGLHPSQQGGIHLSITADPSNPSIVYIGGDTQPGEFGETPGPPNAIGALDYSGRLFRGDSTKPSGQQWVHLTHSNRLGASGGGTANSTAPHADSRGMAFAPNGVLIEVDDGGIYRRTQPQTNRGDWFSMNGDLQVTEFHSAAWDGNCHLVVGGAQDTGTPEQQQHSGVSWQSISKGDGGVVAVDTLSAPGSSIRYSSFYDFGTFRRQVYDHCVFKSEKKPRLTVMSGSAMGMKQFYTPIKLNAVSPSRLIIGDSNSVYESLDQGDTVREIGPGVIVNGTGPNPIAYGAEANPDILYVGAGNQVFVRKSASPSPLIPSSAFSGDTVVGIALNPRNGNNAFVITPTQVFQTSNAGDSWANVTGDMSTSQSGLHSIAYSTANAQGILAVGSDNGVLISNGPSFTHWIPLGIGLPNAPVYHVEYSETDGVFLVGTLGRGAWTLSLKSSAPATDAHASVRAPLTPASRSGRIPVAALRTVSQETSAAPPSPNQSAKGSFELSEGVVIDATNKRVFAMTPDGGLRAVDALTGKTLWANRAAAEPIGLIANRVIAQAETPNSGNNLTVVSLNPETGEKVTEGKASLPDNVRPSINSTLNGKFRASAARLPNGNAAIGWHFTERDRRTIPPGTKSELPSEQSVRPRFSTKEKVNSGEFQMDLSTGAISSLEEADSHPEGVFQRSATTSNQPGTSVDGRFSLTSELTGSTADLEKYTLSVIDSQTKKPVGKFKSTESVVPFIVIGSRVIYETGSYRQREGDGIVDHLPQVKAVDLLTGKLAWNIEIRDTSYRGSFPP
jgi:PQQ-like domain